MSLKFDSGKNPRIKAIELIMESRSECANSIVSGALPPNISRLWAYASGVYDDLLVIFKYYAILSTYLNKYLKICN